MPSAQERFEAVAVLLHERAKGLPGQLKPWPELTEAERQAYMSAALDLVDRLVEESA